MKLRGWSRASRPGTEHHDRVAPLAEQPCQNCGDPTAGNYCRICGQHKIDHRGSIAALMSDTVEDFSLTSELPRTVRALIFKPGFLTLEFSAGRIARYIPPVRLYLAASLVFFLTLQLVTGRRDMTPKMAKAPANAAVSDSSKARGSADSAQAKTRPKARKGKQIHLDRTPIPWLNKRIAAAEARLKELPPDEATRRIKNFMIQRAPLMMFLLLPLFALLTKLLFWGAHRYYVEHIVYALHTHAVTFLGYAALLLLPGNGQWKYVALAIIWGLVFYQLFAMKRVFAQGWIRTILKCAVIAVLYSTLFIMALIAEALAAVLLV